MNEQPTDGRRWRVIVADNFHPYDADECDEAGRFPSLEAARAACERIVMESLAHCAGEIRELTAEALIDQYKDFGDDPYIQDVITSRVTDEDMVPLFSAWKYAERLAPEVCAAAKAKRDESGRL